MAGPSPRSGSAEWKGDLESGEGHLVVGNKAYEGTYSAKSRFEEGAGTNPEELIAGAHAACFSMALSNMLAGHDHDVQSVSTTARVHMRMGDDGPYIARIALTTEGRIPGITQEHFAEHAEQAKEGCPVSRALAAVPEITVEATLLD